MKKFGFLLITVFGLIAFAQGVSPSSVYAQAYTLSPYEAEVDASVALDSLVPSSVASARGDGTRTLLEQKYVIGVKSDKIRGNIYLDTKIAQTFRTTLNTGYQLRNVTIPIATHTGVFKSSKGNKAPVSASVYVDDEGKKAFKAIFSMVTKRGKTRHVSVQGSLPNGRKKFTSRISVHRPESLPAAHCGFDSYTLHSAEQSEASEGNSPPSSAFTRAASQSFTVDIDADPLFISATGGSSGAQATIATVFGLVNSDSYEPYLDLTAEIEDITLLSSDPFAGITDAEALVNAYFSYKASQSGKAAVSLLYTGKDFDGSTIGIAAFEGFCTTNPYISVGAMQRINDSTDPLVIAHELGHLVGSDHYDQSAGFEPNLMESVLNFQKNFISPSVNQINSLLAAQGGPCLSSGGGGGGSSPTPTPSNTPTPTPTPSGGGGEGGSSGGTPAGYAPAVSLDGAFDKQTGELTLTMQLSSIEDGCFVRLLTGKNPGNVTSSGREASRFTPSLSVTKSLSCTVNKKIKKEDGNRKKRRLSIVAESVCADADKTPQYSEVYTLKPKASRKGKGTASKWFRKCARQYE